MKNLRDFIFFIILLTIITVIFSPPVFAGPSSTNYELKEYGFGGGGADNLSSTNYKAFGVAGEVEYGQLSSTNYKANTGLTFTIISHVPPAPTLSNPGTNYDRLKFVLQTGNNPSDTLYAIAISTDNFVSDTRYIQSDFTVGTTLGSEDWQTYTTWGGAGGNYVTTLVKNTTYSIKVKAKQGQYTETPFGPATSGVATSDPSLTFGVSANTITFTNLNAGNSYTDSSKTTVLTTSTNAYNGYVVNARETGVLTHTAYPAQTIADYSGTNATPTTWSGTGFGYTTDDTNLSGGTANRFATGTKYAGFTTSSPGDPVGDHAGPVLTAISNEQFSITYRVSADSATSAGNYTTTVLYMVVPEY